MVLRRVLIVSTILAGVTLIIVFFSLGQVVERRSQYRSLNRKPVSETSAAAKQIRASSEDTDQNEHVLIANVATVSFGELWDLMRSAAPEKRFVWAREVEELAPGTRRNAAAKSFFKIWGEIDPAAAVQGISTIRDKRLQSLAFYAAADAAADSALPEFAELENRLGYRSNNFSSTTVLARWAAADPVAVADFLEAHPMTGSSRFFDVTYSWANAEPEKAGQWFTHLQLPPFNDPKYPLAEDRRRLEAARGLLLSWLDKDSRGAAVFVAAHMDDPEIKQTLAEFGLALCTKSREEATAFIQSLPNEDAQRAALVELLERVGGERNITIIEGGDDEEPLEPELGSEEVRPWLINLPAKLWSDHAGEIFASWDSADSPRAEAWLRVLPLDLQREAIAHYCAAASIEQAPRVIELSALISDPHLRNELLQNFVDHVSDDPSETREKIASLPLTKQEKRALLRRVRNDR
jgi:hypothetical protein